MRSLIIIAMLASPTAVSAQTVGPRPAVQAEAEGRDKDEILQSLQGGETLSFGVDGTDIEVMGYIAGLEMAGMAETWDLGPSHETRRGARWIGPVGQE